MNRHFKKLPSPDIQYGQVWFLSFQRTPLKSEAVSSEIRGGVNQILRFLGFLMHRKFKLCLCNNNLKKLIPYLLCRKSYKQYFKVSISGCL